ncbi:MAG: AAA family ATPase [Cellulosilyticaceae bacterium]
MRPKQLTMIAFGPYGEEQIIDFTKLTEANIFLIHGPTGAGKTTILDAMCYALYGYTNGGERSAENMRSKFAKPEQGAEVELIFTVLGEEYKIFRSPRFERPKLKGTGTTEQLPKVNLSQWDGEKFITLSEKQMDVDRKINELLKFNIEQFRQVIMIAQNKFRELLTVDSKERQKILQDIFETGMYEKIEQQLDQMNSKLAEELKVHEMAYTNLLGNIDREDDEILGQYIETKVLKNAPQVVEILKEKSTAKAQLQENLGEELVALKNKLDSLQKKLIIQNEKYNALIEKQEAKEKLTELHEKASHYLNLRKQVEWGQKAEKLMPLEEGIIEVQTHILEIYQLIESLKQQVKAVGEKLESVEVQREASKGKLPYVEELKKQYSIWETYLPKVEELSNDKQVQKLLLLDIKGQEERLQAKVLKIQSGKDYIETAQKQIEYREVLNATLTKQQLYKQQIDQIILLKEDMAAKEVVLKDTRNKYVGISKEITDLRQRETEITAEYDILFSSWLQNQAGEIAKTLEESAPCPVCGSLSHPSKAKITHEHIDLSDIRKKEADKLKVTGEVRQKQEEQSNIREAGVRLKEELDAIKERATEVLANHEAINSVVQLEVASKMTELKNQIEQISKDQKKMQIYKTDVSELEESKEKLSQEIKGNQISLGQLTTKIEEVQKQLPEDLHSKEALEGKLKAIRTEYTLIEEKHGQLNKEFEKVKEDKTRLEVSLEGKIAENKQLEKQKLHKEDNFKTQLEEAGFESKEVYDTVKKILNQIENMRSAIEVYETNKAVLENKVKELEEKTKDFNTQHLEETKLNYEEMMGKRENGQATYNKIIDYIAVHSKISTQMETLYSKSMKIIHKQHTLGSVSTIAKGKNSKGLSFERYIQSSIFEQVLKSANNKLKPMTGSRYELYRAGDRQDKRKQAGLDITVKDNYVGQTRPVNTLSGGESFMAALALALGLSEVIERLAGATSLDTMFIDEGFGTLDEEALDLAIKTLLNLGDTGRLVGIISHVKELKEQIPARLEIVATNTGSRAEFKI